MTVTPVWKTSDGRYWDTQEQAQKRQKMISYKAQVHAVVGLVPDWCVTAILLKGEGLRPILRQFKNDEDMQGFSE